MCHDLIIELVLWLRCPRERRKERTLVSVQLYSSSEKERERSKRWDKEQSSANEQTPGEEEVSKRRAEH